MFWIKKQGKWVQLNDKPIIVSIDSKTDNKKLNKIPYIGLYNIKPIFLQSVDTVRKIRKYKILTTDKYKDKIIK
jgi:hypothetical protein